MRLTVGRRLGGKRGEAWERDDLVILDVTLPLSRAFQVIRLCVFKI